MRCLTLASELRDSGAKVSFICREAPGDALTLVEQQGFPAHPLNASRADWATDASDSLEVLQPGAPYDWLVVDHYKLDSRWETKMRGAVGRILAIDDLADRAHDCDILLDQNYYVGAEHRYRELVPPMCRQFLGPAFALLRKEFFDALQTQTSRTGNVRRILVSLGAADPTNETGKVLEAVRRLGMPNIGVDVVIGSANPHSNTILEQCSTLAHVECHIQTSQMAALMVRADLAIGAGGATTWERCLLGLPTLTVVTADNQTQTTRDLSAIGIIKYIGRAGELSPLDYERELRSAMNNQQFLNTLTERSRALMARDSRDLRSTRNHPVVEAMLNGARPKLQ